MSAKRTRMSPQARRQQLIDEGLAMANEASLDEVTVEAVAERAGVSRALLFHYFATKQDFHVEMAREQAARLLVRTEPDLGVDDAIAVLRGTIEGFVDFVVENRGAYLALLRAASSTDPAMAEVLDQTRTAMVTRTLANVSLASIDVTPAVELTVYGWLALAEDIIVRWLTEPTVDRDTLITLVTTALPLLGVAAGQMPTGSFGLTPS